MNTINGLISLRGHYSCEIPIINISGFRQNILVQSSRRPIVIFYTHRGVYELSPGWRIWQEKTEWIKVEELVDFQMIYDRFNRKTEIRMVGRCVDYLGEPDGISTWIDKDLIISK